VFFARFRAERRTNAKPSDREKVKRSERRGRPERRTYVYTSKSYFWYEDGALFFH